MFRTSVELRNEGDTDDEMIRQLLGHAALFNVMSQDLGGFQEVIRPGAFKKTISEGDIRMHWNHNHDYILGRTKPKTLRLSEDDQGLAFENDMPSNPIAQSFAESVVRGDVDQMSFGFRAVRENWIYAQDDRELDTRELLEIRLFEISPVVYAAYRQTDVEARAVYTAFNPKILKEESNEKERAPRPATHPRSFSTRLRLLEL